LSAVHPHSGAILQTKTKIFPNLVSFVDFAIFGQFVSFGKLSEVAGIDNLGPRPCLLSASSIEVDGFEGFPWLRGARRMVDLNGRITSIG
jgi:hypothetical protein